MDFEKAIFLDLELKLAFYDFLTRHVVDTLFKAYYAGLNGQYRPQAIGVYSEVKKCRVTLLVMWCFLDLLGIPRDYTINVFLYRD